MHIHYEFIEKIDIFWMIKTNCINQITFMEEWVTANISRETSILQFDFSAIVKVSKADICYQLSSSRLLEENDVHPLWSTSGY